MSKSQESLERDNQESLERQNQKINCQHDFIVVLRDGVYRGGMTVGDVVEGLKEVYDKEELEFMKSLM
jgi:hypothetical protein